MNRTNIDSGDLFQLTQMQRLRVLNCRSLCSDRLILQILEQKLNIKMKKLKIADSTRSFQPENGFWNIEAKQQDFI